MRTTRAIAVAATLVAAGVAWGSVRVADAGGAEGAQVAQVSPVTPPESALVELGRRLFFDSAVTKAGLRACADCHDPEHGYADPAKKSADLRAATPQHTQTLIDCADSRTFHWHGELASLADVITPRLEDASAPQYYGGRGIEGTPPIATTLPAFISASLDLKKVPAAAVTMDGAGRYREAYSAAFGSSCVTTQRTAQAIEAYVRTIRSGASPYDRHIAGDENAMSPAAVRGLELFRGRAGCASCHAMERASSGFFGGSSGSRLPRARFSDYALHEMGPNGGPVTTLTAIPTPPSPRRKPTQARSALPPPSLLPGDLGPRPGGARPDRTPTQGPAMAAPPVPIPSGPGVSTASRAGLFKTPTLRDVARRSPLTHTGECASLEAAVRLFLPPPPPPSPPAPAAPPAPGAAATRTPEPAPAPEPPAPLFDDADVADLVAFLEALTSDERPGLAHSAWSRRAPSTRLRLVDADGRPLARLAVSITPAGDTIPTDGSNASQSGGVDLTSDADGFIEFTPPPSTHARVALACGVEPLGGPLVPDTCRLATLRVPVSGRAEVHVTLPAALEVPQSITVDHPDARRFRDRRVPTTTLECERTAPLAGGRVVAVYSAPLRTDVAAPARLLATPGVPRGVGSAVVLSKGEPAVLDLSR